MEKFTPPSHTSPTVALTVVVIALNAEKTLERTLQSIQEQNFDSLEVICVDDGSTDATLSIMERWAERDSRFRVLRHTVNKGSMSARYDGLMAASGKYILFIDSDDAYEKGAFQKLTERMEQTGADLCEFGVKLHFLKGSTLSPAQVEEVRDRYLLREQSYLTPEELLTACFIDEDIKVNIWNKIYRTELVKDALSFYDQEWLITEEDWLFTFCVLSRTRKYDCFPEKCIVYSVGGEISTGNSLGSDQMLIQHASALRIYKLIEANAAASLSLPEIQPALDAVFSKLLRIVVYDFANFCEPERCQLFLDTALQYCSINDFLVVFSSMASEGLFADVQQVVRKLKMCRLPGAETRRFLDSLSAFQSIGNLKEIDRYYRSTITWRVGRVITWLPGKIRDFLISRGSAQPRKNQLQLKTVNISTFKPLYEVFDLHSFFGLAVTVEQARGRISDREAFLGLEYERGIKLLLVTDDAGGKITRKTLDCCREHGIHLTILSLNPEKRLQTVPEKAAIVIECNHLEKLYLSRFTDLFDGLIIDTEDFFSTIEQMRSYNRKTLILTSKAIVVGQMEKYCLRKEYDLENYLDWLIYGNYIRTDDVISVIIPTLNAGDEFDTLLCAIEQQRCIQPPEIIVIDSGSTDNTLEIARKHQVRLYTIPNEEFSHSGVRNMGAELASGKYLLFTTQDALPSSCLTFCRLLQKLLVNHVAAVSPAEEYKPGADLYARKMICEYRYDYFLTYPGEVHTFPKNADYAATRINTCVDDVMCMTDRDIFLQFRYRGAYAEDCDYGLRLAQAGYSIGRVDETKVIHSHNRLSRYFMERNIVDILTVKKIYKDMPVPVGDAPMLASRAISLYGIVMLMAKEMQQPPTEKMALDQARAFVEECQEQAEGVIRRLPTLDKLDLSAFPKEVADEKVVETLGMLMDVAGSFRPVLSDLPDLSNYVGQIVWLQSLESRSFGKKELHEISVCLEKYAASRIGQLLGAYMLNGMGTNAHMDRVLNSFALHI